jgi:predicted secreted hydrolase
MPAPRGENRAARWLVAALLVVGACGGRDSEERAGARLSLTETLSGGDTLGYARALAPRTFEFPRDHGPHGDFRTEWWYVTGNLDAEDGRRFGFQFTIFRSALAPASPDLRSAWATNQAYMGHFTVTDVAAGTFRAFERFARGAAGLAGASGPAQDGAASSFRVWIEDWALDGAPGGSAFPMRLRAAEGSVALELTLDAGKPRVLQGDQGLSQKGPEPGNASFYYAHTRMPASGTVIVDGEAVPVTGLAWMDREWSTSVLSGDQVGWDWFSLQLDDGWEVMVYQLRLSDGRADPLSDGVLIDPEGRKVPLEWGRDLTLEALGSWTSPVDGARYPSGWRLTVPERGVDLRITPLVADQELDLSFRYWEGAVEVRGTGVGGGVVQGRGYVELTGYAGLVPDR